MRTIPTFVLLCATAAVPAFADDIPPSPPAEKPKAAEWFADYDKAVEAAKAQKKDLLVDFTGSDWCIWCIRLHEEVFSKPEFESEAPKSYVLVALDFPRGDEAKAKVPNQARNEELMAKYGIEGFPTVLVLTTDGDEIGRSPYGKGGPKVWLDGLEKSVASGRAQLASAVEWTKEFDAAQDDAARTAAVTKSVDALEKAAAVGGPKAKLASNARHGAELDVDGKSGLAARSLKAIFAAGQSQTQDGEAAKKLDAKNEAGLREVALLVQFKRVVSTLSSEEAVAAHKPDVEALVTEARAVAATGNLKNPDVYVEALANACGMAKKLLMDDAAAKEIATALREKGPKNDERLAEFLKQILGEDDKATPPEKK